MKTLTFPIRHMLRRLPEGVVVFLIVLFAVHGCVIPRHRGVVNEVPPPVHHVTPHFPCSYYRLAPGDVLEFLYLTVPSVTKSPYRLGVRDLIDLEFTYHPELNRSVRVRPDGRVSLPRKKDVKVAGRTTDEVSGMLERLYADLINEPEITVSVREFNAQLDEIQEAISTAPNGQSRVVAVAPDGMVTLPFISDLPAQGLTVPQLTKAVNERYRKIIPNMEVSVVLREVLGNLIFVDGEVTRPGVFNVKGPTTVQQAVALAGGMLDTAEPRTVLVVSKALNGKYSARTANMTELSSASDYTLRQGDLVYVPKSVIARADVWVDQNLRRILLFNGWSIGLDSDLGRTVTTR